MTNLPLDIRTLSLIAVMSAFVSGIGLVAFSLSQRVFQGLRATGSGVLLMGCGFLLISLRDAIPLALSVIAANSLLALGLGLVNDGICLFRRIPRTSGILGLVLAIANLAAFIHFTYAQPVVQIRIFAISVTLAAISALCCRNILSEGPARPRLPQGMTALGFAGFSAFMLFRACWALSEGHLHDFMSAGTVHGLAFLAVIFLFLCISYGLVWIADDSLEKELRISERIIATTPDMIVLVDEHGTYRMVNDAGLKILGGERGDILGKSSADLFGKEFYDSVTRPSLEKAFNGEVTTTMQWLGSSKTGKRYVALYYHPVPDAEGNITMAAINARDMTDLHAIQEERQRIFAMSLDMLCIADLDGRFKELNPAWERILGWDRETLMRSQWIDFVHPDDVQASLDAEAALTAGSPVVDFVNRYRTSAGSYRFLSWTSHPDLAHDSIYAVARDVTDRVVMEEKLRMQATHDPLTGAGNRRLFMQRAGEEIERSIRYGAGLSLLMLDIDHFKAVNDTYGHDAGDMVLKALVAETRKQLRTSDVFCRLGGEEFAALLLNADAEAARALAERIRQALAELTVAGAGAAIRFTVSLGVTTREEGGDSVEAMLKRADTALYAAKKGGRNRVVTG